MSVCAKESKDTASLYTTPKRQTLDPFYGQCIIVFNFINGLHLALVLVLCENKLDIMEVWFASGKAHSLCV